MLHTKPNYKKGMTLFIAISVTIVSMLFTAAIANLTLKELILTQTGRDSQIAFYAANTGTECALYHDTEVGNGFNPPDPEGSFTVEDVFCVDNDKMGIQMIRDPDPDKYIWRGKTFPDPNFYLNGENEENGPCFTLEIVKTATIEGEEITKIETEIESRGYNTCNTGDSRRVERALRVNY